MKRGFMLIGPYEDGKTRPRINFYEEISERSCTKFSKVNVFYKLKSSKFGGTLQKNFKMALT